MLPLLILLTVGLVDLNTYLIQYYKTHEYSYCSRRLTNSTESAHDSFRIPPATINDPPPTLIS